MTASHGVIDAPSGEDDEGVSPEEPPRPPEPAEAHEWWDRLECWVGVAIVAACCAFVFLQLEPRELLRNTTLAGGDSGAHVWFPAFLRDHLLPWRLTGWAPDYYAGFPAGQFYFPFPALLIVALDLVLPYNVAFKLVTGFGPVLLPIGAYVFARGLRAPRPVAPLMAVAATAFLFLKSGGDSTQTFDLRIMGGTLASTFAGEYSFMIALALSLCFLGTLARALDRRGPLWLPALLFAATLTSHLVVGVFAVAAAGVIWLTHRPGHNFTRVVAIGVVGVLLIAVWLVPVAATLKYTTDMRYEPIGLAANTPSYLDWMFMSENLPAYLLAAVAVPFGIWYRRRSTLTIGAITLATGFLFYNWEGLRELLGKAPAWNLRLLPFWFLMVYLLAAVGAAELVRLLALGTSWVVRGDERSSAWLRPGEEDGATSAAPAADTGDPGPVDAAPASVGEPGPNASRRDRRPEPRGRAMSRVVAIALLAAIAASFGIWRMYDRRGFLPYWAKYNYAGYEGGTEAAVTQKSWPEYRAFMDTANALPPGRMSWEPGDAIGAYGTPLALMLLPYWTHGRIDSMEGLYFEASATTPYHFMAIAALAQTPSNPVRGLPYPTFADFDLGVRYLQLLGVRYYAAFTDQAKQAAAKNPALELVATVPDLDGKAPSGWQVYRVADAATVEPLPYRPVVVDDLEARPSWKCQGDASAPVGTTETEFSAWECAAVPWFADPTALDRPLTDGGPASWQHASTAEARTVAKEPLPELEVTNVRTTDTSVSFDVSRTGVPVMVKTSYFPNWEAHGAKGPWRATPNFMVVVPTSRHVELTYGTTNAEWAGRFLAVVGLAGLGGLVWWGRRRRRDGPAPRAPRRNLREADSEPPAGCTATGTLSLPLPGGEDPRPAVPDSALDSIFKAYDIRGIYPDEIDEDVARRVGNAFVAFSGSARVLVGRDARPSSEPLVAAFVEGALLAGADVIDLGLASTDLCYFAAGSLDAPAAMFTASHNPAEYNGIKMCRAGAAPIGQDTGLAEIKAMVAAGLVERAEDPGRAERRDMLSAFVKHVHSFVDVDSLAKLRVVADTANGVGGLIAPAVFSGLPMNVSVLHGELDGTFPNHPADPTNVDNLRDLQRAVVDSSADVGLAFDGDADRVVLVDDQAQPVSGSTTTAILASAILKRNPGEKVVHNLICSKTVPEVVRELGGEPIRSRVGHSFIKQIMAETGAVFGGEHSAHYYFRDNYRADSGIIAAMMVLEQLSQAGVPLSELRKPFERYAMSGEINTRVADPLAVIERVADAYSGSAQDRLDGLTVDLGDWWFNLRPSNTEPLLRLNLEAADRAACDARTEEVLAIVRAG